VGDTQPVELGEAGVVFADGFACGFKFQHGHDFATK
jgi:hypothetical protein